MPASLTITVATQDVEDVEGGNRPVLITEREEEPQIEVCEVDDCWRCWRQLFGTKDLEELGHDHTFLQVAECNDLVGRIAGQIIRDFDFIRHAHKQIASRISQLSPQDFKWLIRDAYPRMLTGESLTRARFGRIDPQIRLYDDHGILYPRLADATHDASSFFKHFLTTRATKHPAQMLAGDNAELQLCWSTRAAGTVSAKCFARFNSTDEYCTTVEIESTGLHRSDTLTVGRALLVLRQQSMVYNGLRHITSRLLPPLSLASSPTPSTFGNTNIAAGLLRELETEILPEIDRVLCLGQPPLLASNETSITFRATVKDVMSCMLENGVPSEVAGPVALTSVICTRVVQHGNLHYLRKDLAVLREAAEECSKQNELSDGLWDAWADAEDSILHYCYGLGTTALTIMPRHRTFLDWLKNHGSGMADLMEANADCMQLGDDTCPEKDIGPLLVALMCQDILPRVTLPLLEKALSHASDEICTTFRLDLLQKIGLAVRVIKALELLAPCVDAGPREKSLCLLARMIDMTGLAFEASTVTAMISAMPKMKAKPWAQWVQKRLHDEYETVWAQYEMPDTLEDELRSLFGIRRAKIANFVKTKTKKPKKGPRKVEVGGIVESVATHDRAHKQQRRAPRPSLPTSSPLESTPLESSTWSTSLTHRPHRPSQFPEACTTATPKPPRRRDLLDAEPTSSPSPDPMTPSPPPRGETLRFKSREYFSVWRQFFPLPGTSQRRQAIEWHTFRNLMRAEPLCFREARISGVQYTWKREARDGWPTIKFGAHMPHKPWVDKNMVVHVAQRLREKSGWVADDFEMAEG